MKNIEIKGIDETIYYDECDNGLKIYMWVNDKVNTTHMSLAVKYGSIHSEFNIDGKDYYTPPGSAHFLEHVKFNEDANTTAHDFFHKSGADVNAFTTFDFTCYYVTAMENINENLTHLLDFVQKNYFTKALVDKEKGIILEEEKMGEDNPDVINYFGILKNLMNQSNYRNLITGNQEEIKRITVSDMRNIFNNFYHPKNMALFITGNFNPEELTMVIKENQNNRVFNDYKNPKIIREREEDTVFNEKEVIKCNVGMPKVKYGIKINRNKFKKYDDFSLRLIINLLLNINFGSTSDFRDHLIENNLVTEISSSCDIYDNHLLIITSFESKYPEEVKKLVEDKFKNLEANEKDFIRKKKALISSYILSFDNIEKVSSIMQDDYINYGDVINNVKEKYENLCIDDLKDVCKLVNLDNTAVTILEANKE